MSKGSRQRPSTVPMKEVDNNFEGIFGKRVPTYMKRLIQDKPSEETSEEVKENKKD